MPACGGEREREREREGEREGESERGRGGREGGIEGEGEGGREEEGEGEGGREGEGEGGRYEREWTRERVEEGGGVMSLLIHEQRDDSDRERDRLDEYGVDSDGEATRM